MLIRINCSHSKIYFDWNHTFRMHNWIRFSSTSVFFLSSTRKEKRRSSFFYVKSHFFTYFIWNICLLYWYYEDSSLLRCDSKQLLIYFVEFSLLVSAKLFWNFVKDYSADLSQRVDRLYLSWWKWSSYSFFRLLSYASLYVYDYCSWHLYILMYVMLLHQLISFYILLLSVMPCSMLI